MRVQRFHKAFLTILTLISTLVIAALLSSCASGAEVTDKTGVVVTILPQAEFAENIGGQKVNVIVMVPSGASPHTYEPTPSQIRALSGAEMYAKVGSGVEFELVWMDKLVAINKDMRVVDCSKGVKLQKTVAQDEDEERDHGAADPHIWMSPLNAKIMVENICRGIIMVDPENRAYYEQNRDNYLEKLTQLDQDIRNGLSGVKSRAFMVYHPSFGYFAQEYNLTMIPIEEEGKEPTASGIAHLIEQAKEHDIRVIFASPQFNPQTAEVIADEIDGRVILIDPLAKDYINNLRHLLDELSLAMK